MAHVGQELRLGQIGGPRPPACLPQSLLVQLQRGDVRPNADQAAFPGGAVTDADPAARGKLALLVGRDLPAAEDGGQCCAGRGAVIMRLGVFRTGADDLRCRRSRRQTRSQLRIELPVPAVAHHEPPISIEQHETVRHALDGVHQALLGPGQGRFRLNPASKFPAIVHEPPVGIPNQTNGRHHQGP